MINQIRQLRHYNKKNAAHNGLVKPKSLTICNLFDSYYRDRYSLKRQFLPNVYYSTTLTFLLLILLQLIARWSKDFE